MTDEERQKLVDRLRAMTNNTSYFSVCVKAADELERLAKRIEELEQRDRAIVSNIPTDKEQSWGGGLAIPGGSNMQNAVLPRMYRNSSMEGLDFLKNAAKQSNAEPVAWRYKPTHAAQEWAITMEREPECKSWGWRVEPLYTAPPRPDTQSDATLIELEEKVHFWQGEAEKWMKTVQSIDRTPPPDASAGLIEAAEWHEELAKEKLKQAQQAPEAKKRRFLDISFFHDECASALRSRAAERRGK